MSQFKRAVLFVNGIAGNLARIQLHDTDYLVAVDGGLRYLQSLQRTPHLLIGDLDSVDPALLPGLVSAGVEILRYPPAKDQTDLELALYHVIAKGYRHILLVAALGGRLDQTLANLALLTSPDLDSLDISLDDGDEHAYLVRSQLYLACEPGERISLIPICTPVRGITTSGLAYPLVNEILYPHQTRGISNEANSSEVTITIESGLLLCLHTCKQINEN